MKNGGELGIRTLKLRACTVICTDKSMTYKACVPTN